MFRHTLSRAAAGAFLLGAAAVACERTPQTGDRMLRDEHLVTDMAQVADLRVYFGHQSVGGNVVNGLRDLSEAVPGRKLVIVDSLAEAVVRPTYFLHTKIGVNGRPETKYQDFSEDVRQLRNSGLDIALCKLCYVDFDANSVPEDVLARYDVRLKDLRRLAPKTIFVHVTTPLTIGTVMRQSVRDRLKTLLRPSDYREAVRAEELANGKRNRFNELLVQRYAGEPLFDLARVESTRTDGTREAQEVDGRRDFRLVPQYTTDGGHLNQSASRLAARELLRVLSVAAARVQKPL
jgi:hypothetical protein